MVRIVARASSMACTAARRSPRMSVMSPASIAMSLPVPIAMPDVGLRERRRVVDAVADHGDHAPLALQAADLVALPFREHARHDAFDPGGGRDRVRGARLVAREHHDVESERVQPPMASTDVGLTGSAIATRPASLAVDTPRRRRSSPRR